ncbi:aldo/keto reductase [Desulfolucanica intricata]|uniref:aldo/keto reductase n=1 Tax=Desulfolucanica intricata TaxID=1285191 RepID=UPI00082F7500|nr:aldo/keto reductase [Desulfolucanica intricata]
MKYRTLGKTGLKVSVIGFGGIPVQRVTAGEAEAIINRALDLGINFFDTARGYTDSEEKLGAVLRKRRKEAVIATKSMARTGEGMTADIQKSLKTLGVDYIDLYQLHNVKDKDALEQALSSGGALAVLKEAQKDGVVRHIGITGHVREILLEALKEEDLETVQFPFNAVEADGAQELLDLCEKRAAGIIVMKPLAGGALRKASLALRFILDYPVSTIIPGMDSIEQVEENALVGKNMQPLNADERKLLDEEAGLLGAAFCRRCEYCRPCLQGIDIPMIFLLEGYYTRYDLKDWAVERYRGLQAKADACIECGECEDRCPYNLPIRRMLADAAKRLGQ